MQRRLLRGDHAEGVCLATSSLRRGANLCQPVVDTWYLAHCQGLGPADARGSPNQSTTYPHRQDSAACICVRLRQQAIVLALALTSLARLVRASPSAICSWEGVRSWRLSGLAA